MIESLNECLALEKELKLRVEIVKERKTHKKDYREREQGVF